MLNFLSFLLSIHVVSGFLGLILGPVAMLSKKGSVIHKNIGRVYVISLIVMSLSAFAIAFQRFNFFLLVISVFTFYLVICGYRSIYLKVIHRDQPIPSIDWFINVVVTIFSLGLIFWAFKGQSIGYMALAIYFGLAGLYLSVSRIYQFLVKPKDRNHWFYHHMIMMLSSYIAILSAFSVVNIEYIPGIFKWLWPSIIGAPLIFLWVRKYKAKFVKKGL